MDFAKRTATPPSAVPLRLMRCIWRQAARSPVCAQTPRLDGKCALVTGGNAGIGLEISRGLARRGAEVIVAARNTSTSEQACKTIAAETGSTLHHVRLDLADLDSVVAASAQLKELMGNRPLDILVANAGIWPKVYAESAQRHEIAFATNTLGHHVLVRRMLEQGLLRRARVVVLTGDIYIRQSECTSDFKYEGASGGALAYSRSKLGNIWFAAELQRRYPDLEVCAVHPGVIASGLGGKATGFAAFMQGIMLLDVERGAQTPLWCATQPDVERGAYYHNTMGRLVLSQSDPAASAQKAGKLWALLEQLSADFR
jgi:NAD(P)-dependent dehydrogenase (short-subunit alcohol dehydrogenase family)